jgi:hypothetical protein
VTCHRWWKLNPLPGHATFKGQMAWREVNRRWNNGALYELAGVAPLGHPKSRKRYLTPALQAG